MTNIKYLKSHDLYDAHQHFMRLSEAYIPRYPEEELDEAGEEDAKDPNMGNSQSSMGNGEIGAQDPNMGDGDPNIENNPNDMGGMQGMEMGNDQSAMGDENVPQADPSMDAAPIDDEVSIDEPQDESQDDGDTIDIDGLTKAQDKLNAKQNHVGRDLSKVDNRIEKLIGTIQSLQAKLDSNNSEIESLKAEFEKRNPTQTEKLNLRSLDSYPFNVKPNEYWENKAKEGGYDVYGDNEEPTSKEYVITNDDVDNPSDDIANTFFKVDDDDIQTLEKMFNL